MSNVITLIKFLPTIIVGLGVLGSVLTGFRRGFRKSLILFIHYIIAFAIGLIMFFIIRKSIFTQDLNSVFISISNVLPFDLSGAHTIYDAVEIILAEQAPDYASLVQSPEYQQILAAVAGILFNFVFGIICLLIVPFIIRTILYLIYLLFYREGKYKKRKISEGDTYHRRRSFGMLVGVVRGIICSTLAVSLFSSIYFVVAGGDFEAPEGDLSIFASSSYSTDSESIDMNEVYRAFKESRNTGVGMVYEKIKIGGEPIDYFMADLFVSSEFKSLKTDKKGNAITKKLNLRKELGAFVGLFEEILESEVITIEDDGTGTKQQINYDKLTEEFGDKISSFITSSTFLSDIVPLAIVGTANAIKDGTIPVDENIKSLFTDENVETIKNLDFANDIAKIINISIKAVSLLPIDEETGKIDTTQLEDPSGVIELMTSLDTETVKDIFQDLSEVTLISKAIVPIGVSLMVDSMHKEMPETEELDIDFDEIDWQKEIANFGNIYKGFVELDLDIERLMNAESNSDGEMSEQMKYIFELVEDEDFIQNACNFLDTLIGDKNDETGSYLLGQISLIGLKYALQKVKIKEDSAETLFTILESNFDNYSITDLKGDLKTIFDSCLSVIPLYQSLSGASDDMMSVLLEIDTDPLLKALVGEKDSLTGEYQGGLYDLKLFANGKLDNVVKELLLGLSGEIIPSDDINAVTNWKNELIALVGAVNAIQDIDGIEDINFNDSNFLSNFPTITDANVDNLTEAISDSVILSSIINSTIIDALNNNEAFKYAEYDEFGNAVLNPDGSEKTWKDADIQWTDVEDDGVVKHGEINKLLKVLTVISAKDSLGNPKVDLENPMPGIADLSIDEVDKLTDSKVLTICLNTMIKDALNTQTSEIEITVPSDLVWANKYDNENNLVSQGELWSLIQILNIEAFQNEENEFDLDSISNLKSLKELNVDDDPIVDDDIDILLKSRIISENIPNLFDTMLSDTLGNDLVDVVDDWNEELHSLVKVIQMDEITLNEDGSLNDENLFNLNTLANLISKNEDDTLNYSKTITAAKSRILMKSMSSRVQEVSTSIDIVVPSSLVDTATEPDNYLNWAYDGSNDYSKGEFARLIKILYLSREALRTKNGDDNYALVSDDLIAGIVELEDHHNVTNSLVIYASISNYLIEESGKAEGVINIRDEAIDNSKEIKVKEDEIVITLQALKAIGVSDFDSDSINTETIIDATADEANRRLICNSNILNITIVDKLIEQCDTSLVFPTDYDASNKEAWYPTTMNYDGNELNTAWKNCELNHVLTSISELTEGSNAGIIINGDAVSVNTETIVCSLNDSAVSNTSLTKIDVVYDSNVFAATISDYIINSDSIVVPITYKNSELSEPVTIVNGNIIVKDEIVKLVNAVDILNLTFDNDYVYDPASGEEKKVKASELNASVIIGKDESDINELFTSAIISMKTSLVLADAGVCEIPTSTTFDTKDFDELDRKPVYCEEISQLIISIKKMDFDVDNANTFNLKEIDITTLGECIDDSNIFHATMSTQIADNVETIPASYHLDASTTISIITTIGAQEYLAKAEIVSLVRVLQDLGMEDSSDTSVINSSFISSLSEEQVANISSSAIITAMISKEIVGCTIPNTSSVINNEDLYKYSGSSTQDIVTASEMDALLMGILHLGISDIADTSTINISTLDLTYFDADITSSYILRATISEKITNSVTTPNKDVDDNSIKDSLDYLIAGEISALVKSAKTLGLEFDGTNGISSDNIAKIDINDINDNIDEMLSSAIIHKLLSDNVIGKDIVPAIYYSDASTTFAVTATVDTSTFVIKSELKSAIAGLKELGVTVDNANTIDRTYLATITAGNKIDCIGRSAVLSKIFSKILIDESVGTYSLYQVVAYSLHGDMDYYSLKNVNNANTESLDTTFNILSQEDIKEILANVESYA